ncbi:MAG: hypothetical protein JW741_06480 [Sedimentisphaerales bacterium]|nr:hypothetical protein [Sedimentisphaerales bacterium]
MSFRKLQASGCALCLVLLTLAGLLSLTLFTAAADPSPPDGNPAVPSGEPDREWFVAARLNYATWGQPPEEDFPDGDVDARLADMARIGMRDYFIMRGDEALRRQIYAAAEKYGVRVWLRTFGQARYSEEDVKEHPERLFQMDWTKAQRISCPSWPENQVEWVTWTEPLLREERDHLYGVNLDFIRYPDDSPCSCGACTALYREWLGRDEVTEEDLEQDEELARKYADMRNAVISGMVARVRAMCDRVGLKLSVCVFANLDHARMLGQDWPRWAREGLVDVVCPMSYTSDRAQHQHWLRDHVVVMDNQAELWDSVARAWDRGENTPDEVLVQSLHVLRGGADGLVSFNMASFTEEDWRLQSVLRRESGWIVSLRDQTLRVDGPPFAWMKLPLWPVNRCVISGDQMAPQKEGEPMIVRSARFWMDGPRAFPAMASGRCAASEVVFHNGTTDGVTIEIKGRLPDGWRIEAPAGPLHLVPGESRSVAVVVCAPQSVLPGRYWVDIMAEDTKSGRPVPRAVDAVESEDALFTILPLSGTRFSSASTWLAVDVAACEANKTGPP